MLESAEHPRHRTRTPKTRKRVATELMLPIQLKVSMEAVERGLTVSEAT